MKTTRGFVGCGISLLALIALSCPLPPAPGAPEPPALPAFPGAEGFGASATGGRGGRVIEVTNLNDRGPGSLRAAVEAVGPRIVVFRVSGTIPLASPLKIRNGDLTIAGQTAPGDGICLKNYDTNIGSSRNMIIRFLRFRPGDSMHKELDALGGRFAQQIIIDHCSASWSIDECLSFYRDENITVQWCLISESLYRSVHSKGNHGYGGIWGGQNGSFHHNLLAHHSSRNPRFAPDNLVDHRNNVIYNWGFNSAYGGERATINIVANYYKPGPATRAGVRNRILDGSATGSRWYVAGNLLEGFPALTADNWAGGVHRPWAVPDAMRARRPFAAAPVTTQKAAEAYRRVLASAGASRPKRDPVDARIVAEVRTGTARYGGSWGDGKGIIDSQTTVGGWPELRSTPPPPDSDHDGMPDAWETRYGLDPHAASDGPQDRDGDGYTNVEEYLNDTDPIRYVDYRNPRNNR